MDGDLRSVVERLKAVSHPLRLRVLALLQGRELCVCQVADTLEAPASSVSEALRELRRAGFVTERKEGRWVYVSVDPAESTSPLLRGILVEAERLPEAQRDRLRVAEVQAMAVSAVCERVRGVEGGDRG